MDPVVEQLLKTADRHVDVMTRLAEQSETRDKILKLVVVLCFTARYYIRTRVGLWTSIISAIMTRSPFGNLSQLDVPALCSLIEIRLRALEQSLSLVRKFLKLGWGPFHFRQFLKFAWAEGS